MRLKVLRSIGVNNRRNVGGVIERIADFQFPYGPRQHLLHVIGDILLQEQGAQGRAALAGAIESRPYHVSHNLFRQRRTVDDHRIDPAGLRDEGDNRSFTFGQRSLNMCRGRIAARKDNT